MDWTIYISRKAQKQLSNLSNPGLLFTFRLLIDSLKMNGPIPGKQWLSYGKLKTKKLKCQFRAGKNTVIPRLDRGIQI